jgi:hypothetical protein
MGPDPQDLDVLAGVQYKDNFEAGKCPETL